MASAHVCVGDTEGVFEGSAARVGFAVTTALEVDTVHPGKVTTSGDLDGIAVVVGDCEGWSVSHVPHEIEHMSATVAYLNHEQKIYINTALRFE